MVSNHVNRGCTSSSRLDRGKPRSTGRVAPWRRAFTVLELSIAMVIGLLLITGIFTLYQNGSKMFRKVDANLEAVNAASIVTTVITDDLRNLTVTVEDLKTASQKHNLPITLSENAQGLKDAKITQADWKLSEKALTLQITDPEGAVATPPRRDLISVELSLKPEKTPSGKQLFVLSRKNKKSGEEKVYHEAYVKDVLLQFLRTKEEIKPAGEPAAGDEQLFYVRLTVIGASTSLMENTGTTPDAQGDFYKVPLIGLYALDCISELVTARGLGKYWQRVDTSKAGNGQAQGPQN